LNVQLIDHMSTAKGEVVVVGSAALARQQRVNGQSPALFLVPAMHVPAAGRQGILSKGRILLHLWIQPGLSKGVVAPKARKPDELHLVPIAPIDPRIGETPP